jgi:glycosyltransferase involved in cell wall biosynthesis
MMKVSIAMATFNGEKFLKEQLNSFLDQTRAPDEIIICDDGSSDGTLQILREFAENAPFNVRIIKNPENIGFTQNFNKAIDHTTGDLVFLSDQDDVWFPEKIEYIEGLAREHPEKYVFMNDVELADENLTPSGLTKLGQINLLGFTDSRHVMGCASAYRREIFKVCLPIPVGIRGHDSWIVFFANALGVNHVDHKVLQYYRRHENNESYDITSRLRPINFFDRFKKDLETMTRILKIIKRVANWKLVDPVQRENYYIDGLERAVKRSHGFDNAKLEEKIEIHLVKKNIFAQRLELRKISMPKRLFSVLIFYFHKRYGSYKAFRNVVRDLLGSGL